MDQPTAGCRLPVVCDVAGAQQLPAAAAVFRTRKKEPNEPYTRSQSRGRDVSIVMCFCGGLNRCIVLLPPLLIFFFQVLRFGDRLYVVFFDSIEPIELQDAYRTTVDSRSYLLCARAVSVSLNCRVDSRPYVLSGCAL